MSLSPLPFKCPPMEEFVDLGTEATGIFSVPKKGSLNFFEAMEAVPYLSGFEVDGSHLKLATKVGLAQIILKRIQAEISIEQVKGLATPLIEELADFFLNEWNCWQEVKPGEAKKLIGQSMPPTSEGSIAPSMFAFAQGSLVSGS